MVVKITILVNDGVKEKVLKCKLKGIIKEKDKLIGTETAS